MFIAEIQLHKFKWDQCRLNQRFK